MPKGKSASKKSKNKGKNFPWVRAWRRNTAVHTFLEDTANVELQLSRNSFNQLVVQHRPHLRRVRRREIRDEIRQEGMRIEQQIERQNETQDFLMNHMKESFEQEENLSQRHTAALERLAESHSSMRTFIEEEYYGNLRTLMAELCAKTNMLTKQNDDDELKKLEIMEKILDEEWADEDSERRTKFLSTVDEIKNRIMEEKQILRIQMEHTISELYQKMEDEYVKYKNRTEEKLVRYQELRAKDEISSNAVKYQIQRINLLSEQVAQKKAKLATFLQTADVKIRYWQELKSRLTTATSVVKRRIRGGNNTFRKDYKEMTLNFQAVHDQLLNLEKLGIRLVRHALATHRMQEPDDKLFTSVPSHFTAEEQKKFESCESRLPLHEINQNLKNVLRMKPYMMNNAHMELKNTARRHENKQLRNQNVRLENLIREYVQGKTITDDTLNDRYGNPLLRLKGPTYVVVGRPETFRITRNSNASPQASASSTALGINGQRVQQPV